MCVSLLSLFGSVELFHKVFSLFPFLKVWSTSTCEFVRTLNGHKRGIACLQYRDRLVVSGSSDNTIRYDPLKVNPLFFCLKKIIFLLVKLLCNFSPKKFSLVCFCLCLLTPVRPSVSRLWDIECGACLRVLEGHEELVRCIRFDNKRIVSGAYDGSV